jgi:hypothetical protein
MDSGDKQHHISHILYTKINLDLYTSTLLYTQKVIYTRFTPTFMFTNVNLRCIQELRFETLKESYTQEVRFMVLKESYTQELRFETLKESCTKELRFTTWTMNMDKKSQKNQNGIP